MSSSGQGREIWLYFAVKTEIPEGITTAKQLDKWIDKSIAEDDLILPDSSEQFFKWEYADGSGLENKD